MTIAPSGSEKLARELEACPWCKSDMSSFGGMHPDAFAKGSNGTLSVSCDCGVIGPEGRTMEEAVTAWGTRFRPTPPADEDAVARQIADGLVPDSGEAGRPTTWNYCYKAAQAALSQARKDALEEAAKRLEREWPGPAANIVRKLKGGEE